MNETNKDDNKNNVAKTIIKSKIGLKWKLIIIGVGALFFFFICFLVVMMGSVISLNIIEVKNSSSKKSSSSGVSNSYTYHDVGCEEIIVEINGIDYDLEEYVAGVIWSEFGLYGGETAKVNAIAARSVILTQLGEETCTVTPPATDATFQVFTPLEEGTSEYDTYMQIANSTKGIVATRNGSITFTMYLTIPNKEYITENSDGTWTIDLIKNQADESTSHQYTMPYTDIERIASKAGGILYPDAGSTHHYGVMVYGAVYEEEKGKNYEEIIELFYGSDVELVSVYKNGGYGSEATELNNVNGTSAIYDGTYTKTEFINKINAVSGLSTTKNDYGISKAEGYNKYFKNYASEFYDIAVSNNLDPRFLFSIGILESGYGSSKLAVEKNNLFGIGHHGNNPFENAASYSTPMGGASYIAERLNTCYIQGVSGNGNCAWIHDKIVSLGHDPTTVEGIAYVYSEVTWGTNVVNVMKNIFGI